MSCDEKETERNLKRRFSHTSDPLDDSYSDAGSSEFEEVPLVFSSTDHQALRKQKIEQLRAVRNRKRSVQYLSILCYMTHGLNRNKILGDKTVKKTLRKLLPEKIISKAKHLKNSIKKGRPGLEVKLIYILKYLIKWFRLNYKITSNGLRVLGYLPEGANPEDFFPLNGPQLPNKKAFLRQIKKFEGNRDLGAQLFTGLLRGLGFEARLVFSLPVLSAKSRDQPKFQPIPNKDFDLLYPYFWTELINPLDASEIIVLETCCFGEEKDRLGRLKRFSSIPEEAYTRRFCPTKDQLNLMEMSYVITIDEKNLILDASSRYMKNVSYRWFNKLDLRTQTGRSCLLFQTALRTLNARVSYNDLDNRELNCLRRIALANYDLPKSISSMKVDPNFTTFATLRYNEVLDCAATPATIIKLNGTTQEVFFRSNVVFGKSEQQWKFLGRSIKPAEIDSPIKMEEYLPRTISNKRRFNLNKSDNATDPNKVGLYSFLQTCPYRRMEVHADGTLPTNDYGNIEIYRESMLPIGCTWLKLHQIEAILRSQSKVTRSIPNVSYVPVVTEFRFDVAGHAIPVKSGVIVNSDRANDAKRIWLYAKMQQDQQERKERYISALQEWNDLLKRLRIHERLSKYDHL